jgi:hypothetical protein
MRKLIATLLLLLVISNTLTPILISRAENQPESKSFWEKVEDKMIQYAYEMAKNRQFIDYFFIPGVGGGKQDLGGTGGLYAVMLLLPSIKSEDDISADQLLGGIISSSAQAFFTTIAKGGGIKEIIEKFHEQLSQTAKTLEKYVVSFYLPYQRIKFRVIAIVWIQAQDLLDAGFSSIVEKTIGVAFDFMKALIDKKLDELMGEITEKINGIIDPVITNADQYISVTSSCNPVYEPIYDEKGNLIGYKLIGYNVEATAAPISGKIQSVIESLKKLSETVRNIEELGYKSFMDIIENYDDVTEGMKNSDMYSKLFDRLKTELKNVEININEVENILNSIPIQHECARYDEASCPACKCEEDARNKVKNALKEDLTQRLINIRDKYFKKPLEDFLIKNVKNRLSNTLNPIFKKAEEMIKDIATDIGGAVLSKIPLVGTAYVIADAIHQVFAQTLTEFDYVMDLPENTLIELADGGVQYSEGKKISGTVMNKQWWEGCIKAAMMVLLKLVTSPGVASSLNYIPQIFAFDIDFSNFQSDANPSGKGASVITGGKPGIYMMHGEITFKNVYSNIGDFLGRIGDSLKGSSSEGSKGRYVGSKESKDKVYHYPWCFHAKLIKPENKIFFRDECDAARQGYRPCEHCKPPACGEGHTFENDRYSIFTDIINEELPSSEGGGGNKAVSFAAPYIVASAFPVVNSTKEINEGTINVKMAAIMDIGSFIKPVIREAKEELKEKLREGLDKFIGKVVDIITNSIIRRIERFIDGSLNKMVDNISGIDDLLKEILKSVINKIVGSIGEKVTEKVDASLNSIIGTKIKPILEWISREIDISTEKLEEFISITTSVIAIPVRGMEKRVSIVIPSMNVFMPIDGLGYCKISISKESLIAFSTPVSAARSYVAFSSEDAIGMIPYSMYSYEPFVVQVFSEISSWPNTFKVKWIPNPGEEVPGVSIKLVEESGVGTRLVMLRDSSQAQSTGLRYIPNPYPYAETYVKLDIKR